MIEEEKRTRRCLDQSSYDLVIKECEKELVEEHTVRDANKAIKSGSDCMLNMCLCRD